VAALGEALKDPEATIRASAAAALGKVGPAARAVSAPLLVEALRDAQAPVVTAAAEALGKLGPPQKEEVPALTLLLRDKTAEPVRRHALDNLAALKEAARPAAAAVVAVAGGDPSSDLRRLAVRALLEIRPGGKESLDAFSKGLGDTDVMVARQSALALAQVGAEGGALPALLRALGHADEEVVKTADDAFEKVTWDRSHAKALADALTGTARPALRGRFLDILAKLGAGAADAVPALRELLKKNSADEKERMRVVVTLGKIGPAAKYAGPDLIPLLKRDPKEKDPMVRLETAFTLVAIGADEVEKALPTLIAGLVIDSDDAEQMERRERVSATLVRLGKPAAEPLATALHVQFAIGNWRTPAGIVRAAARLATIKVLVEMGPKEAGSNEVLLKLARLERDEPFREVRAAARAARLTLQKKEKAPE
jgi:HEAT repeat protein